MERNCNSVLTGEIHGLKVLSKDVLPEFIVDATFYTVTSKAKIHIFLSSKIHIVLEVQIKNNISQTLTPL